MKTRLTIIWILILVFITSGCGLPFFNVTKSKHRKEASLAWYSYYWIEDDSRRDKAKSEYQKKIEHYLELYPQTSKEIADKMRNCTVTPGMTKDQILAMVKPHYILKGKKRNEQIFKYSDVGKIGWTKFIGEGTKVWIALRDGVVTDISELDKFIGF